MHPHQIPHKNKDKIIRLIEKENGRLFKIARNPKHVVIGYIRLYIILHFSYSKILLPCYNVYIVEKYSISITYFKVEGQIHAVKHALL